MQETANKQKRMTLKTLHEMLNGMSVELAEKVHLQFMASFRTSPVPFTLEGVPPLPVFPLLRRGKN